jgi:transposase-like protein
MGKSVPDLCREHGMSSACFYQWRSKYGGMDASLMKRMKDKRATIFAKAYFGHPSPSKRQKSRDS